MIGSWMAKLERWTPVPLRLIVGYGFMAHGYAKILKGPERFVDIVQAIGFPAPEVMAWATIVVELVGGLMVMLGFYHRLAALGHVGVMVGAIFFAKMAGGFFAPAGIEFELTLGVAALTIALAGGGAMALQDSLKKSA